VKVNCIVANISMKQPCVTEVLPPRRVLTAIGPGNVAETAAAAAIPPAICPAKTKRHLVAGIALTRNNVNVTYECR
jgi:hypothetical protein